MLRTGIPLLATPEILAELERQGEIELIGAPAIDWLGVPLKIKGKNHRRAGGADLFAGAALWPG